MLHLTSYGGARAEAIRRLIERGLRRIGDGTSAIRDGLKGMKEIMLVVQHDLETEAVAVQIMMSVPEGLQMFGSCRGPIILPNLLKGQIIM
jgi:hypothetical protein